MKMNVVKSILLWFILFLFKSTQAYCPINSFKCAQNQHRFGIIATSPILDEMEQTLEPTPVLSKSGKSFVTLNRFGFDVMDDTTIKNSWLIQEIAKTSKTADHPMLDIGGGYGRLTKVMLNSGATVIYNDLEPKHLIYGRQLAQADERQRLYLNSHSFPRAMILEPNSLTGVVLYRVAHFMKPDEFEEGIAKIKRWLVPGGKVFIAVLPPQHSEYQDRVLPVYNKRWEKGNPWPGYNFKSHDILPSQAYALPKQLHLMDERPLIHVLTKYGFTIEKHGFIDMKRFGANENRTGQELFGIIAIKPGDI